MLSPHPTIAFLFVTTHKNKQIPSETGPPSPAAPLCQFLYRHDLTFTRGSHAIQRTSFRLKTS